MPNHTEYMKLAAKQAKKALFITGDNPRVGCIVVKNGKIVGKGHTQRPGEAHAEIMALNQAGKHAVGATVYVTLEPCSHYGRTPPCAEALIEANISQVWVGRHDPNPDVSGSGIQKLRSADIKVEEIRISKKANSLNIGFFTRMETGLPWVRVKMAQSLDGRTAMANGDSVWITGEKARQDVQMWRGRSQAILTGVETVLADDCRLTVRPEYLPKKYKKLGHHFGQSQPLRVILDTSLRTPPHAKILSGTGRTIIMTAAPQSQNAEALKNAGVEIVEIPTGVDGRMHLSEVLKWLANAHVNEVLVEAGATLAGQFVAQNLANQLIIYTAPALMGSSARPLFELDIEEMAQRRHIHNVELKSLGRDWRILADL